MEGIKMNEILEYLKQQYNENQIKIQKGYIHNEKELIIKRDELDRLIGILEKELSKESK